jgi:hypothetical protein
LKDSSEEKDSVRSAYLDILKVVEVWRQHQVYEPEFLDSVTGSLLEISGLDAKEIQRHKKKPRTSKTPKSTTTLLSLEHFSHLMLAKQVAPKQPPAPRTSPGLIPPITTPLEKGDFAGWFTFATTLEASDTNMGRIRKLES